VNAAKPKPGAYEPAMIFLTTLPNAAGSYAKRWKTGRLFRHLKTNGYTTLKTSTSKTRTKTC
jgi:hypothetical protein